MYLHNDYVKQIKVDGGLNYAVNYVFYVWPEPLMSSALQNWAQEFYRVGSANYMTMNGWKYHNMIPYRLDHGIIQVTHYNIK
jgi:hypothetical protein